jgi:hypothetical protein
MDVASRYRGTPFDGRPGRRVNAPGPGGRTANSRREFQCPISWTSSTVHRPSRGDKRDYEPNPLVGRLEYRYTFHGEYDPAEILGIEHEGNGQLYSVLCGKTVLRSFLERENPQVGGRVGIKALGKRAGLTGREYDDFNCAYEPPKAEPEPKAEPKAEPDDDGEDLPF